MTATPLHHTPISLWLRRAARGIVLLWVAFWIYFGLASGLGEGLDWFGILLHTTVPGLLFLAFAFIAWRWERQGGILLILLGMLITVWYPLGMGANFPPSTVVFVLLTMALPPALAGLLWLVSQ